MFLASCGAVEQASNPVVPEDTSNTVQQIQQATDELPEEIVDMMDEPETSSESEDIQVDENSEDPVDPVEVEQELEEVSQAFAEPKVVELATTYNNPSMEVVMNIEYELSADETISSISVTSPNYRGMPKFNDSIQNVIGMSVDDAAEYYVS